MKIIHIGNVGLRANGVGQVIENLSYEQKKAGHHITILTARKKKEPLDSFIEIHKLSEFKHVIDNIKPDIFIFHSLYIYEYIKFYTYLIQKKIPYLIQLHGALSKENYKKNFIKKWIANVLFFNKFIRRAKSIIYLNKNEYDQSIVKTINPSYLIIPNGCPEVKNEMTIDRCNHKVEILYLGRIDFHHKGLDKLIEAIRILNSENLSTKVHFSFYGFGDQIEIERLMTEFSNLDHIANYYGPIYGLSKNKVYQKSNIFILTSRYEGMPMGVLEALANRLPCIITEATNMGKIIKDYNCGWITNFEAKDIANTIKSAFEEYSNNSLQFKKNAELASQQYTWRSIAEESIKKYSKFTDNNA